MEMSFIGMCTLSWPASNVAADVFHRARGAGDMDAAFGLVLTRPAAGADVLALFPRLGAGPAADRGEALGDQRMRRQVVLGRIGVQVGLGPVGQGIELQLA